MTTLSITACASGPNQQGGGKKDGKGAKPPAEAFTACESKSAGQSCTVTSSRGEMTGTCKAPPQGEGELACVPANNRPQR
ncbi:hypothetical protein [Thiomicrorhabdus sp. Milos-T2]|uniref:hypothetical protein n=1 Tax=Thiomicrorhabdus sp. Milos-T2 TaxID=90814 RepID=UPI0004940036|nr:hypothetical protein [Thiomicrorhabdus sp. Milos-T2]